MRSGQRRMGCPNAVPMVRLPTGSLAAPVMVWWIIPRAGRHCRPRCCCQRDSLAACKQDASKHGEPGAHGMNRGQSKMNGGKLLRRAVGMAWQRRAGTQPAEQGHCRRTQPVDSPPGSGLKKHNSQQMAGLAAKQQPQTTLAGLSPCSAG